MILPTMMGRYGSFGYTKELGKCDYIVKDGVDPKVLFYSLGFGIPAVMIILSYFGTWRTTLKSSSSLNLIRK